MVQHTRGSYPKVCGTGEVGWHVALIQSDVCSHRKILVTGGSVGGALPYMPSQVGLPVRHFFILILVMRIAHYERYMKNIVCVYG